MKPKNINELKQNELQSTTTGEKLSISSVLTEAMDFSKLFVHYEEIPPGRKSSAPHEHTDQEEMVLVLEGTPTAHVGKDSCILKPGDFIGFKPGTSKLHFIENSTSQVAKVLVISSKSESDSIQYKKF